MDVMVQRAIAASPASVARVMFDPGVDPKWIGGAKSVERLTPGAIGKGSRVRREGGFLGRKFGWVTEVTAYKPERRLEMRFVEGPMKGGVTYEIEPVGKGSLVSIRNQGPSLPGMGWFVKQATAKDLDRLAAIVEISAMARRQARRR
jgi:hypothetical protein